MKTEVIRGRSLVHYSSGNGERHRVEALSVLHHEKKFCYHDHRQEAGDGSSHADPLGQAYLRRQDVCLHCPAKAVDCTPKHELKWKQSASLSLPLWRFRLRQRLSSSLPETFMTAGQHESSVIFMQVTSMTETMGALPNDGPGDETWRDIVFYLLMTALFIFAIIASNGNN